jgi:molecular chaperone GrpE
MTTGKRQIPINDHGAAGGPADSSDGGRSEGLGNAGGVKPTSPGAPAKAAPAGGSAAKRDTLDAQLEKVAAERDALVVERDALATERDALAESRLRLQAEFENFRKRVSRDAIDSHVRTQCEVMNDFLPVLDNLERALDAAEHHEEGKVLGGVRMTRDMFVGLLARAGVEEIEGVGAPFDPLIHDAVLVQPSEQDEGVVVAILERGYRQGDRVLRPAQVIVSAGRAGSGGSGGVTATG